MRPIDADELMEHVWRDRLDSRDRIAKMVNNAPTIDCVTVFYKKCFNEFLKWMRSQLVKDYKKEIEDYEKAIHNYQQQIINLTEKLDKTRVNRDLWFNHYKELAKECNALHNKADEIMMLGASSLESPDSEKKAEDLHKIIDMLFEEY